MVVRTRNPYTGGLLAEFEEDDMESAKRKLSGLKKVQVRWKEKLDGRIEAITEARRRISKAAGEIARLITLEMGKTIAQSEHEVKRTLDLMDYFLKDVPRLLTPEETKTEASRSYVRFDPLGTVLLIEPWNSPLWQVMRPAVPALLAGNCVLLKHASNVTGTSLKVRELLALDAFDAVVMQGQRSLDLIPFIDVVSFTGSSEVGAAVAQRAGAELKKSVLELGGSDPFIVLDGVDMKEVARNAVTARLRNNGQSCVAAKRFLVKRGLMDEFYGEFKEALFRVRVGDPLARDTELGPLATEKQKESVEDQVEHLRSISDKFERAGEHGGNFVSPTLTQTSKPYGEEIFGPVAVLKPFDTLEEAVTLANDTPFGLGTSIWGDPRVAESMAPLIEAGNIFVNQTVTSDPRMPFGGVKKSGFGRELSGYGLKEFTNIKSVWVR